jgi:hypothetical protein
LEGHTPPHKQVQTKAFFAGWYDQSAKKVR